MSNGMISNEARVRIETVPMEVRYLGAWSEINNRIAQRQNALSIFIVLSIAVLGYIFSRLRTPQGNTALEIADAFVSLILPVSAAIFAALNQKHDETIAVLRHYLKHCEESRSSADTSAPNIVGYNSHEFYLRDARTFRRLHDVVFAASVLIICAPIFMAVMYYIHARANALTRDEAFLLNFVFAPTYWIFLGGAIWMVAKKPRWERAEKLGSAPQLPSVNQPQTRRC
jgi:hypothetical protein